MAELIGAIRNYNAALCSGINSHIELASDKLSDAVKHVSDNFHTYQKLYALIA